MGTEEYTEEEIYYEIFMGFRGFGYACAARLIRLRGSLREAFYLPEKMLERALPKKLAQEIRQCSEDWLRRFGSPYGIEEWRKEELSKLYHNGIYFSSCASPDFPKRLLSIQDIPLGLYYKGKLLAEETPSISIIGARTCSNYGVRMAMDFAKAFANAGVCVVSGMARGIDGIAQRSALQAGGISVGVLGCGVDVCYPVGNRDVFEALPLSGGLVSEYPPGTEPRGMHFPRRNRIISALGDALLVVEARNKSGTLITVDMALDQGKEVYVLPGRVTDPLSAGCNRLIKQGASLVESPEELLAELGYKASALKRPKQPVFQDAAEKIIWETMDDEPKSAKEAAIALERGGISMEHRDLMLKLSHMVMDGYLEQPLPGFFAKSLP